MVINRCYGGFSLSSKAILRLRELGSEAAIKCSLVGEKDQWGNIMPDWCHSFYPKMERHNPLLVQVVEELGDEANGRCSKLKVVTAHVDIGVSDFDGMETVSISGWSED